MLDELIKDFASLIRDHSWTICFAWTASLLVIYGDEMLRITKSIAQAWHFAFRLLFFVIICGFGYGALTIFISRYLHGKMILLSNLWLCISVIAAYIFLGFLAERNRVI